jgi:hypothetical protein
MAKARVIETKVVTRTVILELTEDEAHAIRDLTGAISRGLDFREHTDAIYLALVESGFPTPKWKIPSIVVV